MDEYWFAVGGWPDREGVETAPGERLSEMEIITLRRLKPLSVAHSGAVRAVPLLSRSAGPCRRRIGYAPCITVFPRSY